MSQHYNTFLHKKFMSREKFNIPTVFLPTSRHRVSPASHLQAQDGGQITRNKTQAWNSRGFVKL